MGFFDLFKPKAAEEPVKKRKLYQRVYSGVNSGRLFADYVSSNASSDAELSVALQKLRDRSRDLARNNEYGRRYFELMRNNVVGDRGFQLQVKAENANGALDMMGNEAVEAAFAKWGRRGNCTVDGRMSWIDVQKLAIESIARDGEVFIIKHRNSAFHDTFSLEFIEADQVDHTLDKKMDNGHEIRMGVEVDQFKRPVAYWLLTSHPGDTPYTISTSPKHRRVPAERVIHAYIHRRAGQTRGEPWLSSTIDSLKQLSALREASIINARVGASKMGFITSPAGDGYLADDFDDNGAPVMNVEPGEIMTLAAGQSFQSFDPDYPAQEFAHFHKAVLKGIASGMNVSYTAISNDLEATSYSSIRQGALEERDNYRQIQNFMVEHVITPIYMAWMTAAMEMNSFGIPYSRFDKFYEASTWRGRQFSWVDPLKESQAAINGLRHGVMSLQDVAQLYGKDVTELLKQISEDRELMKQYGINYALEPYGAAFVQTPPDIEKAYLDEADTSESET